MKSFFYKISALFGILIFSQMPLFVDQYAIRLEGHVSECNRQIEAYKLAAKEGDKTLDEYANKFLSSLDSDFQREGALIKANFVRAEFLHKASLSLKESSLVFRPFVFVRYADEKVAQDAWKSFAPGFSFTVEGVAWSAFGAIFGIIFCASCRGFFARGSKEKSEKST